MDYHFQGTHAQAMARVRQAVARGSASTLLLVTPPPPAPGAVTAVRQQATTEQALEASPEHRAFWQNLGDLCKPWGCVALAHPTLDDAAEGEAEEIAMCVAEMARVEVGMRNRLL